MTYNYSREEIVKYFSRYHGYSASKNSTQMCFRGLYSLVEVRKTATTSGYACHRLSSIVSRSSYLVASSVYVVSECRPPSRLRQKISNTTISYNALSCRFPRQYGGSTGDISHGLYHPDIVNTHTHTHVPARRDTSTRTTHLSKKNLVDGGYSGSCGPRREAAIADCADRASAPPSLGRRACARRSTKRGMRGMHRIMHWTDDGTE